MSTDTPRTTERLHLLENEHDDVAFESLSDFARQLERELAEAKASLERLTEGFPITDVAQVVQLQQQLVSAKRQTMMDSECIERITKHGLELEQQLAEEKAKMEAAIQQRDSLYKRTDKAEQQLSAQKDQS